MADDTRSAGAWVDDDANWDFPDMDDGDTAVPVAQGDDNDADATDKALPSLVDDDIVQAMEEMPANWFGMRFEDIPIEDQQEAWIGLRRWVDRFVVAQNFGAAIAPCWFQHPDAVIELYSAMCADYKVWEEGSPSVGPWLSFQTYLPGFKQRLIDSTMKHCMKNDKHSWTPPAPMEYDENAWAAVRDTVTSQITIPRHETANTSVRVKTRGESEVRSEAELVGALSRTDKVLPVVSVKDRSARSEVVFQVRNHREDDVVWQTMTDDVWEDFEVQETADEYIASEGQ